jgi:hypothetical protein
MLELNGPTQLPDPSHNAYRRDLADVAIAEHVVASHYAEPLPRQLARNEALRAEPSEDSEILLKLEAGDHFEMLDDNLGWAWGYGGRDRCVGYVRSEALTSPRARA